MYGYPFPLWGQARRRPQHSGLFAGPACPAAVSRLGAGQRRPGHFLLPDRAGPLSVPLYGFGLLRGELPCRPGTGPASGASGPLGVPSARVLRGGDSHELSGGLPCWGQRRFAAAGAETNHPRPGRAHAFVLCEPRPCLCGQLCGRGNAGKRPAGLAAFSGRNCRRAAAGRPYRPHCASPSPQRRPPGPWYALLPTLPGACWS